MKVRYIYITQLLISLIPVKENASEKYIGLIFLPFVIAIVSSIMIVLFHRKFDSRYPKIGEKHYTEKIFKTMDEGERRITLVSMYKVNQNNTALLLINIILIGAFSILSDVNQTVTLIILIILFTYNRLFIKGE
ncbi:DUF3169 family protein [Staphylococcus saccharolyticus]|uniref:Membrane protein n=1 Tax=Staphylococcus saccharolyticus TaxID=33028 RepID=A0A380HB82_9STAP|nr:DUF3169 family protein [Staphylococcus saccharolyticus]MBL7564439.1 DUF3169 family protein [Staphylococcus saccharolyticus]MBL7571297.1 DUF3169 family protein [Staphylococcus saccharolyticus]QQB99130.1 DUF3169 family protein [Staphylococcus saccharolyticus]QRJ66656.1 DUF3169 family protein [Staphylococcus saccharolyticus]RTX94578.1 DUF3169 family protein [Staphylococcus saccharolyticus]